MKKIILSLVAVSLIFIMTACFSSSPDEHPDTSDEYFDTSDEHFDVSNEPQESTDQDDECEVVFLDFDNTVLKTETVTEGSSAQPPVASDRDGYIFVEWDTSFDEVTKDIVVKAVYEEVKEPTLIADTVYAEGEDVVVKVRIKKNPGVLTLFLNTIYVEHAMELVKVESGEAMDGYTFTPPNDLCNGCNIAWHILDVPKDVTDGEVALLHFKLKEGVAPGAYEISVTSNYGSYDAQYNEIQFESIKGYVTIDSTTETKEEIK